MNHDYIFRLILTGVLLMVLPIGLYHRVRSQTTREKLDRRQEGLFILVALRLLGAVFWLGTIAWMIVPRGLEWSRVAVPGALRWLGVAMLIAGASLLVWTFRSLGSNLTDTVVTRQRHTLVVDGPYRWVRHPLYMSAAVLIVAIALITANWFLFATGTVVFSLLAVRTRTEERNLLARFGEGYRTYMARTGRFLPGVGASRREPRAR